MLGLEGDRHWPQVVEALGVPEWLQEERFSGIETRMEHSAVLTAEIDAILLTKERDEWGRIFDEKDVWWAPVQSSIELLADPQSRAAGCWVQVSTDDAETVEMVASPIDFSVTEWEVSNGSPSLGQDTELVLNELGIDWERIIEMKESGVIP